MKIEIPKVSEDGSTYEGEEPSSILGLEHDRHVKVGETVSYRFFAQVVSKELIVKGTIRMQAELECSRCTEFYSTTVEDSSFLRAYEITDGMEVVDVTEDIRENMLLALPSYPVCSSGCKGLCTQCGKNLNEGPCACRPPIADDRWGSLDQIKLD